jgi:hypothetical protein
MKGYESAFLGAPNLDDRNRFSVKNNTKNPHLSPQPNHIHPRGGCVGPLKRSDSSWNWRDSAITHRVFGSSSAQHRDLFLKLCPAVSWSFHECVPSSRLKASRSQRNRQSAERVITLLISAKQQKRTSPYRAYKKMHMPPGCPGVKPQGPERNGGAGNFPPRAPASAPARGRAPARQGRAGSSTTPQAPSPPQAPQPLGLSLAVAATKGPRRSRRLRRRQHGCNILRWRWARPWWRGEEGTESRSLLLQEGAL